MSSSSSGSEDDEGFDAYRKGGYHAVRIGDSFAGGRYIAQRKLGWGQFSTVWLTYDTQTSVRSSKSKYVALKIQKSAPQFAQAALHEIELLSAISDGDPSNEKCVPTQADQVQSLQWPRAKPSEGNVQVHINWLDYLHRELGIIHTDLKLENILLISTIDPAKDPVRSGLAPILERPEGSLNGGATTMSLIEKKLKRRARRAVLRISGRRSSTEGEEESTKLRKNLQGLDIRCKVVDFGNACWADKQFAEEIQTRQYRAPEVILRSGYSFSVDMWSFACTAFELATGEMMFTPQGGQGFSEDEDHLAQMMELLGKMPRKIAVGGSRSKDYFDRYGDLKRIRRLKFWPLDQVLVDKFKFSESDAREFAEFLNPLLDFTPENRPTAQQCLQHPWLNVNTDKEASTQ
ncbi:unnamed protein product [Thlaspi arvense]|uniref:non-specific serine/threonine protein kinase n=1 Tax=Thlaspi arvense TaxID=13288 RepID=A0AAU9RFG3_THLAR|nr:unnamed protein product [Thlaspi arvense]